MSSFCIPSLFLVLVPKDFNYLIYREVWGKSKLMKLEDLKIKKRDSYKPFQKDISLYDTSSLMIQKCLACKIKQCHSEMFTRIVKFVIQYCRFKTVIFVLLSWIFQKHIQLLFLFQIRNWNIIHTYWLKQFRHLLLLFSHDYGFY